MTAHSPDKSREYSVVPRVGVGVVLLKNEKFVLVKRGHEPSKGIWTIPGGLVELGECLENTAQREIYEECGLSVELLQLVDYYEFIDKDDSEKIRYHYIVIDFLAVYKNGVLRANSDAEQAQWFSRDELNKINTSDKTISVINKALSIYQVINNQQK